MVCGTGFSALAALVAAQLIQGRGNGFGDLIAVLAAMLLAFPAGVSVGVVVSARLARWPGRILPGVIGTVLGAVFVVASAEPLRLNTQSELLFLTYALCISVFAAVGFTARLPDNRRG